MIDALHSCSLYYRLLKGHAKFLRLETIVENLFIYFMVLVYKFLYNRIQY